MKKNKALSFLILALLLALVSIPNTHSIVQAEPGNGSRTNLDIKFYSSYEANYVALKACEVDLADFVLTTPMLEDAIEDPNIQLVHLTRPKPRYDKYVKEGLPDFGQHSSGWCWVAALANSLYWYAQNGYPGLLKPDDLQPEPESTNPNSPWFDPGCAEGYPKLFRRIAEATPDNTDSDNDGKVNEDPIDGKDNDGDGKVDEDPSHKIFCETVSNEEYEAMLDKLIRNGPYECVLDWNVDYDPTFFDYMGNLSICEDVILVLEGPDTLHAVTGRSFDNTKTPPEIDISDPWTDPGGGAGPSHNNDPRRESPDAYPVLNSTILTIMYDWGAGPVPTKVHKMYYISPKPCKTYKAYKHLLGTVNADSMWTFINAYSTIDPSYPIKYGLSNAPEMLNPIYSVQGQDWRVLSRIYEPFIVQNPYDPTADQPWLAKDWDVATWVDGNETKIKVTCWFKENVWWTSPSFGEPLAPFTTNGYEFNCWYYYQTPDATDHELYASIHHIKVVDDYQVEIYFDEKAEGMYCWPVPQPYFRLYAPAWKREPLAYNLIASFHVGTNITTPGPLPLPYQQVGAPVEVIEIRADGTPLQKHLDYEIIKGEIWILVDLPFCTTVEVDYWARGDAYGYFPGGLSWEEILIGTGPYYLYTVDVIGAYVSFNANPFYHLETPPLGEIDWRWYWEGTTKPRSGCFKIDIYDVVKAAIAYGSQGYGIPDSHWFPGADIATPECIINIYDIVAICIKYSVKWGFNQ